MLFRRLDLDAWINDPPSESEDESVSKNGRYETNYDRNLFTGDQSESYYHGTQVDSHGLDPSSYGKAKNYVEPSEEEIAQQRESRKQNERMNPFYLPDKPKSKAANNVRQLQSLFSDLFISFFQNESAPTATAPITTTAAANPTRGTIPASLQLSFSDQLYRQSKIDEENRRLKKKSKGDGSGAKKGKKASKNADPNNPSATVDENDDDLYPVIKVVRGGELPEGARESDHDDDYDRPGKNKKTDPHRALNINLEDKSIQKMPSPPVAPPAPAPAPAPAPTPVAAAAAAEKPKKTKKKEEKSTTSKSKSKRERSDYKELGSPADEEQQQQAAAAAAPAPVPPVPTTTTTASTEEKPKKKKTKEKKSTKETAPAPELLFDIMSDDINPTGSASSQRSEEQVYKVLSESEHLTVVGGCVSLMLLSMSIQSSAFAFRIIRSFQWHPLLN